MHRICYFVFAFLLLFSSISGVAQEKTPHKKSISKANARTEPRIIAFYYNGKEIMPDSMLTVNGMCYKAEETTPLNCPCTVNGHTENKKATCWNWKDSDGKLCQTRCLSCYSV